jgi:CheY-like chemotaxis protein
MRRPQAASVDSLRGVHVFVVDDEPPSLELVSRPLEYHGALVTTCRTLQAPRLMSHMIPNVVVIEVPAADDRAYALVREIRAATSKRRAPVPAIALMPLGSSAAARRIAAAGFRAAVPQPFHVRDLCATILDVVKSG